jgi:hypothetical protein
MEVAERIQGRVVETEDLVWLRTWIEGNPDWSRKQIARELCLAWQWRDGKGRLKDFAARSLLLKLAEGGRIVLPPLRTRRKGGWCLAPVGAPPGWAEPAPWEGALEELRPLSFELVEAGTEGQRLWSFYLSRYHYLGLRIVGENVGYLVRERTGRVVACFLFGAAAWRCAARDRHLGWATAERAAGLGAVANNTRFLILPWVRVPHLASHLLGLVARRIDADWRAKYQHGLRWLETFVERDRFLGTCYRAANWVWVGETTGRSRQDREMSLSVPVKDVYLYRLGGGR